MQNFICPVTGISFGTKNEVLDYCASGGLQRAIEAKNTLDDKTTLQVSHQAYLSIYLQSRSLTTRVCCRCPPCLY